MEDADAFAAQTAQAEAEAATWAARLAAGEFDGAAGRTPAMDGSYDNPLQGTASMGFSHSPPVFQVDKGEDLVPILSAVLQKLVERDDQLAGASQHASFTVFHALKPPAITVHKYLQRIFQYAQCSRSCFIVALIYVDRIIQRNANFRITSLNVHRCADAPWLLLVLVALLLLLLLLLLRCCCDCCAAVAGCHCR